MWRNPRPIFVADPDRHFLYSLMNDSQAKKLPPILAETGPEAQILLADPKKTFAGIFVNMELPNSYGYSVIRFAHQHHPAVPIFIIHSAEHELPLDNEDLKKLGIQDVIAKPVTYEELTLRVASPIQMFDPEAEVKKNKADPGEAIGAASAAEESEFVPIRAQNFLSGAKCFFNVFVRLGTGKFLKILHAGDDFSAERINQFLKKGVTHFYLKKDAQEQYLTYCDQLASSLVKNEKISLRAKTAVTLNHGEETMKFLESHGLSETNLNHVADFVQNTNALIRQMDLKTHPNLKGFFDDIAAYEHGVCVSMITALMFPALSFDSDKTVQTVGLAALLHDVGLLQLPEHLRDEDETKMSPEDRQLYETHPDLGADLLRRVRGISPAVSQAVAQHHERRKHMGFPKRVAGGSINRIAEIIGISDEFIRLVNRSKKDPTLNPFHEMDVAIFQGFSFPVVDVFRKTFLVELYKSQ